MKSALLISILLLAGLYSREQTTLASRDFDANNTWVYTLASGGAGVFSTSNSIGVSSSNGLGYFYDDCLTSASGSTSTVTFNTVNVNGYINVKVKFRMAWGGTTWGNTCGSGTGMDTDDYIEIKASRNGGAFERVCYYNGFSNRQFAHNTSSKTLSYNANELQRVDAWSNIGAWEITFPAGTTSVALQLVLKCNRDHENFYLDNFIVEGTSALPVELANFNAFRSEDNVDLTWTTLSESNSSRFVLLRVNESSLVQTIGMVAAAGNSNTPTEYQFTDYQAPSEGVCYKLMQYDFDGAEYEKAVICVAEKQMEEDVVIARQELTNKIVVTGYNATCTQMKLTDVSGRLIRLVDVSPETHEITIDSEGLSGVFVLQLLYAEGGKSYKLVF